MPPVATLHRLLLLQLRLLTSTHPRPALALGCPPPLALSLWYYLPPLGWQVLDARDPDGTRCSFLEQHVRKHLRHKHLIILLNKCDLVRGGWVSRAEWALGPGRAGHMWCAGRLPRRRRRRRVGSRGSQGCVCVCVCGVVAAGLGRAGQSVMTNTA